MTALQWSITLALIAAAGGATIWLVGRTGRSLPLIVPIGHGLIGVSALIAAIVAAVDREISAASVWAAVSFLTVAVGCGVWMLSRWMTHRPVSPFVRASHLGAAAIGILLLILATMV